MALERNHFGDHALAIKLGENCFLLAVADVRLEFNNGVRSRHRNAKVLQRNFQACYQPLYFRGNAVHVTCGDPENHIPAFQIEALRGPADADQAEEYEARRIHRNGIEPSAGCHADRGFHEDGGSRGHPHDASRFAQNRACAQKADALNNVRSDSRAPRIAKAVSDFAGKNGEQCRRKADEKTCANTRGPAPQVALNADNGSEHGGYGESQKYFLRRKHRQRDPLPA